MDADSPNNATSPSTRGAAYQNSLIEQLVQQQQQQSDNYQLPKMDVPSIPPHSHLNLTNSLTRSQMYMINNEILELDQRMKNIQLVKSEKRERLQAATITLIPSESDPEHIYETIPEAVDSELEPIYSCPYEPQDENIVEQWLQSQESGWNASPKEEKPKEPSKDNPNQNKSSKSNSSVEEHENSSSAYNTGGSCNSNPLTVELGCSTDPRQRSTYR